MRGHGRSRAHPSPAGAVPIGPGNSAQAKWVAGQMGAMTPHPALKPVWRPRHARQAPGASLSRRARTTAAALLVVASAAVLACPATAGGATGRLVLSSPVAPVAVQRLASLPQQPWVAGHRGVDLKAIVGAPVTAPADGVVSYVGFVVDRPVISIRHDQGLVTSLEPVDSTLAVGDTVVRGQTVGVVADAQRHCGQKACVHWGLRLNGTYVDPLDYLEGFGPIGLLPVGDY